MNTTEPGQSITPAPSLKYIEKWALFVQLPDGTWECGLFEKPPKDQRAWRIWIQVPPELLGTSTETVLFPEETTHGER
jgi:hypothetical protein